MTNTLELKVPNMVELNLSEMEEITGGTDLGRWLGYHVGSAFGSFVNGVETTVAFLQYMHDNPIQPSQYR